MSGETWLAAADVMEVTGWSRRHLRRLTAEGAVKSRLAPAHTGAGHPPREFAMSSLPAEYHDKVLELLLRRAASQQDTQALVPAATTAVVTTVPQQAALFATPSNSRLLVPEDQQEEVSRRLHAIQPLLDWRKGYKPVFHDAAGQPFRSLDHLATFVGSTHGVSRATVYRWLERFDDAGEVGLCDQVRSDKGMSRYFREHPEAARFVEAKYVAENLSIALAHESLVREWRTFGYFDAPPSYSTVRAHLLRIPKAVTVVGRDGARGYNRHIEAYLERDFEAIRANQVWVSDHRVYDVFCWNDCFPHERPAVAIRIWITLFEDMRTRKALGWAFCSNPSSESISSALRMAIAEHGIPESIYIDNGRDYKKIGKKVELSDEASGVLHRLGINVTYCLPGHPQSKLIESFFSGQSRRFDKIFGSAYAGSKPALRPEACNDLVEQHKRYLKGTARRTDLMPASEFVLLAEQWLRENNDRPHHGEAMHRRSPNTVFDELCPQASRRSVDVAAIAPLFWDRQKRRVLKGGCIDLYNERYQPSTPESQAALFETIGRDVLVACDPNDLGQAIVLDLDGRLLGYVHAQQLIAHGPVARADIAASLRERRATLKAIKSYIEFRYREVPTELQYLRQRAGLPALVEAQPEQAPPIERPRRLAAAGGAPALSGGYVEDDVNDILSALKGDN